MALLQQRSKQLSRDLSKLVGRLSESVSGKGVHRLRTTIRRLETLLNHAGPKPGKKQQKALDELRVLRKRAGRVRDLDIQIGLLGSIGNGSASGDRRVLAETLKRKRARQVSRLAVASKKLEGSKLFSRLARIMEKSAASRLEESAAPLHTVREQLSQLAKDFSSRPTLKPARLHELRIKLKLLRYQAELAAESPEQKDLIEELKSVQDSIGEWHDWEMLAQSAEKQFGDRINCALLLEIRSLFAARYSAASFATANLLTTYGSAAKKNPSSVQPSLTFARHA